jgi:hypothetical protein
MRDILKAKIDVMEKKMFDGIWAITASQIGKHDYSN